MSRICNEGGRIQVPDEERNTESNSSPSTVLPITYQPATPFKPVSPMLANKPYNAARLPRSPVRGGQNGASQAWYIYGGIIKLLGVSYLMKTFVPRASRQPDEPRPLRASHIILASAFPCSSSSSVCPGPCIFEFSSFDSGECELAFPLAVLRCLSSLLLAIEYRWY